MAQTPIYLTEEDIGRLVTVQDAIATLEELFATWPDQTTINMPRQRAKVGTGMFNLMGAAYGPKKVFGLKAYYGGGNSGGARYHALIYSAETGRLLAMMESDNLGQMRTGAASGLATKLLANADAKTLAVIGTGRQAHTQVAAVCAVRPIKTVHVFSPTAAHRESFARDIERDLGVAAQPAASGEAAVNGADVVIDNHQGGRAGAARELAQAGRARQCGRRQRGQPARGRCRNRHARRAARHRSGGAGAWRSRRVS